MADIVADTTESVVNVDELAKIESLKELVKEAESGDVVSSEVLDNDEDSTNPEDNDQNGHEENEHNGNGTAKEETNGTHEAEEKNGSVDLKRKSEGEVNADNEDDVNDVLPEKKAKLDEEEEKVEENVSSNGDSEVAV